NFHLHGWMWSHQTARRLAYLIDNKLKSWQPKTKEDVKSIQKVIQYYGKFIHNHHHHEDEQAWPFLMECEPEVKIHLDLAETQHKQYDDLWDQISIDLKALDNFDAANPESTTESIKQLSTKFKELKDNVDNHFVDEERTLLPYVVKIPKDKQLKLAKIIEVCMILVPKLTL
ncbi:hypothetical protein SAMD00019534_061850, partial [Acytostelium subglobosum LB1]|uniref:hypothetical protein n=1 Tax=Acytostelium subglobosum LB1 TaxID=1410327 RepID=UPI000644BCD4